MMMVIGKVKQKFTWIELFNSLSYFGTGNKENKNGIKFAILLTLPKLNRELCPWPNLNVARSQ